MERFQIGDLVACPATFTNNAGTATDPTTVTYIVQRYVGNPPDAEQTFVYGVDAEVVKDSTGAYHLEYLAMAGGMHLWRAAGTDAVQQAIEGYFLVEYSLFASVNGANPPP